MISKETIIRDLLDTVLDDDFPDYSIYSEYQGAYKKVEFAHGKKDLIDEINNSILINISKDIVEYKWIGHDGHPIKNNETIRSPFDTCTFVYTDEYGLSLIVVGDGKKGIVFCHDEGYTARLIGRYYYNEIKIFSKDTTCIANFFSDDSYFYYFNDYNEVNAYDVEEYVDTFNNGSNKKRIVDDHVSAMNVFSVASTIMFDTNFIKTARRCVIDSLDIINCSNVELVDNIKYKKKTSGRKGKGLPLYTYKTLHIKPNATKNRNISDSIGTHASPRLHLRRGHIRQLQSGETTWVQSCMVGTKDNGIVEKEYVVD